MRRAQNAWPLVLAAGMAWLILSQIVFAFRHPWATDTERLVYFPTALVFGKVDYSQARSR